jgi:hypothetical protein
VWDGRAGATAEEETRREMAKQVTTHVVPILGDEGMKPNLHITLIGLSAVSLAGLVTGCALSPKETIARSTTEYNLIAEKTGNEMLLLNVVRASKRRPMYFTSFGKLTGNLSYDFATGGITMPFGGTNGPYTVSPSVTYKNSPLFDLGVLDTQEFTCGFMAPVPMTTVEYYWCQGWPKEMLLYLFIRRIAIKGEPEYINDPENQKEFARFQKQIRTSDWKWNIEVDPNSDGTKVADVDPTTASQLKDLVEAQKAGLMVTTKNGRKELHLGQVKYVFTRHPKEGAKTPPNPTTMFATPDPQPGTTPDKSRGTIYLRSPEAILYYLGEILRVEMEATETGDDPNVPMIHGDPSGFGASAAWLFYACKATDKTAAPCVSRARKTTDFNATPYGCGASKARDDRAAPCVSVNYEGTRYVIPGECNPDDMKCTDRSMHVLSLVSQLIGMQKKSQQLPATGVVTVVGR